MLMPKFERFKPHTDTDLVYLKTSPDYCEFDVKKGSLGTHGRECDHVSGKMRAAKKTLSHNDLLFFVLQRSPGIDGCELMCCMRGYTTRKIKRVERCKCKFHWCCFVKCEECYREVEVSTCNLKHCHASTSPVLKTRQSIPRSTHAHHTNTEKPTYKPIYYS